MMMSNFLKIVIKVGYHVDFGINNCKLMMELDFERIPLIYWKLSVSAFYFYVCLNYFFPEPSETALPAGVRE